MVPVLTNGGRSFKGAALYYLHDKRQPGEAERLTTTRIAWVETVNLMTDDPERAWRMMATTAMAQAELKRAAGIKAGGRKLENPVLAYSLAWHPDERPDGAEQLTAARETLKILGLEEHQALIVGHKDEPHAHVHVLANRVHPVTGKAATLSLSQRRLQAWALEYEQARGKILCPARAENEARRQRGKDTSHPRVPRPAYEERQAVAGGGVTAAFIQTEQAEKDAALAARGRQMHETHRRQWAALKQVHDERRKAALAASEQRRKAAADAVKARFRRQWSFLFRHQKVEQSLFDYNEASLFGRIANIAGTFRAAAWQGATAGQILGAVFNRASGLRVEAFRQTQEKARAALAATVSAAIEEATAGIKRDGRAELARLREEYLAGSATLKAMQEAERAALRQAWHDRNAERRAAFGALQDRPASPAARRGSVRREQPSRKGGRTPSSAMPACG